MNKKYIKLSAITFILLIQTAIIAFPYNYTSDLWDYSMRTTFIRNFDLFETFNATPGYRQRQNEYLICSKYSEGFYAQSARIYSGLDVNEESIENSLDQIYNYEDCMDFTMNGLIRMLYLDINKSIMSLDLKNKVIDALGRGKYWYTEPSPDTASFTTENHQLLYHTAEYLLGQLFPNDTFTNSDMTGQEHVDHALPLIKQWLDWKIQFGFNEWHSNVYYVEDISPLVNLIDFAMDSEVVNKSAIIMDIMTFDFACNYFKGRFATTMGRCYDNKRVITSSDSVSESAWILLGINGTHNPCDNSNMAAVALATSKHYAPPPILENIYRNASKNFTGKERHNIDLDKGKKYGIKYNFENLPFWLGMQSQLSPEVIELIFKAIDRYDVDPQTFIGGPQELVSFFEISSWLQGLSVSEYSETLKLLTRGAALDTANCYTYRTSYYQLSGVQDHAKGMCSNQKHIWQASLDDDAYVFTNSPGGITKDLEQLYMGGWNPRYCAYKNVAIIQYDREVMPFEGELAIFLLNVFLGLKFYQHAYFPKSNFDKVEEHENWIFGAKNDGYIALYSYETGYWASDYEYRVDSQKNMWIVELGSGDEYDDFDDFIDSILDAKIEITPEKLGYDVNYKSPSQGNVKVGWSGSMRVDGNIIDLGPYPRFDNEYCYQEFGTKTTIIKLGSQSLEFYFENSTRIYRN